MKICESEFHVYSRTRQKKQLFDNGRFPVYRTVKHNVNKLNNIKNLLTKRCTILIQISPNILYELRIPNEERLCGSVSQNTICMMQESVMSWPAVSPVATGMEHFLGIQIVSDKSVSDCVEAIIGTYLVVSISIFIMLKFYICIIKL